jgi:hypothetical protein
MIYSMPMSGSQVIRGKALGFTGASQDMFSARTPLEGMLCYCLPMSCRANDPPSLRHLSPIRARAANSA